MASIAEAERAQQKLKNEIGRRPGVRGVGLTWDRGGNARLQVNIDSASFEDALDTLPRKFDGVDVEYRRVSRMRALAQH